MGTDPARVLFVNHTSDLGGPSISLLKLLKFIDQVYEVAVVAPGDGELFRILEEMGIAGHRAPARGLTRLSIPWLCQLITRGRFDLVYGNNYGTGSRNALVAAKLTRRPYVWHIREMLRDGHQRTTFFLKYADAVIAVSRASARAAKRYLPGREIHVIHNGIEPGEFQLGVEEARDHVRSVLGVPPETLVVANVGAVCLRKGQSYALEMAAGTLRNGSETVFPFLGRLDIEPSYALQAKDLAARLKINGLSVFLGFRRDVPLFLRGCDVFLHTPLWDPNPRVVLEAMGAGLPVVAFDVDGVSDMIDDGKTGYLIPFGDVDAGTEALAELLDNASLRLRMGELGRKRVQAKFTAEETAGRIEALIGDLLDGSG